MIHIIGDTHGIIDLPIHFKEKTDYLINCGDFGAPWNFKPDDQDKIVLEWYENQPFTTLFIPGNHENYTYLNSCPTIPMFGGEVKKIWNKIYMLQRGHYYNIEGHSFLTLGGATSKDKSIRIAYKSWWPDEEPSSKEYNKTIKTCREHKWKFDYILTHTIPYSIFNKLNMPQYGDLPVEKFLDILYNQVEYKEWFAGHWHMNKSFDNNTFHILYEKTKKIS